MRIDMIQKEACMIYGVWKDANDRTVSKDIQDASVKYHATVGIPEGQVLPYFILSRDYDELSRNFKLLVGSTMVKDGLEQVSLPAGEYACITIRPKLGFLWGLAIGEAKQYFYKKWLPQSEYESLNMEYEFHTEKSVGKHPTVDVIFAVRHK